MDRLSEILALPESERAAKGLVHTPREIFQQPDTWRRTCHRLTQAAPNVDAFLKRAGVGNNSLRDRLTVFLVGAGTSDYIGRALAALLRRQWQCEVHAVPSTDLLTCMDELLVPGRHYLWVSFSRSGDSSEGVAVLELALERWPEIHHVIVCCNSEGRMARCRDGNVYRLILADEVNDRGLAMTSSFSNMIIAGQTLAHLSELDVFDEIVERLSLAATSFLPRAADLAGEFVAKNFSRICFLGTGPLKSVAIESALKVLELTAGRVVTFAESFLGLRHGPLSAIDDETLVVGFLSGDKRRRSYEIDLLEEIQDKQLAQATLAILPVNGAADSKKPSKGMVVLPMELKLADVYRPPIDVFVGQLFGLFASMKLGLKPDAPSPRGAISRVVSQVKIY
jgi:tagatose-6-phosphate ketose/aldose isomerase